MDRLARFWLGVWATLLVLGLASAALSQSVTLRPIEGDDTAHIQAAIDAYATVTLVGDFDCAGTLYLDSGTRLTTDRRNPASIKRTGDSYRLIVINGSDTRINNLRLDWGFDGQWLEYRSLIAFAAPDDSPHKPGPRGANWITGVEFVASSPMGSHTGRDCWCVSLTSDSLYVIPDVRIQNCRSWAPGVQLIGNGNGPGFDGLTITGNQVHGGHANAIGISSRETTRQTVFRNVRIERNVLLDCYSCGVFIGQDGSSTAADVWIDGLVIRDNLIHLADNGLMYQTGILIRGGQVDGCQSTAPVEGNTVDLRGTVGRQASWLTHIPAKSGSKLDLLVNRTLGLGDSHARGVTGVQAGNAWIDNGKAAELRVAY